MKYVACALPMLAGVEVLSLICLCVMAVCLIADFCKAAPKDFWEG